MDHSLSLEPTSKEISKQNKFCYFHISPGSSKNKVYKIWTLLWNAIKIANPKSLIGMNLPFEINGFKIYSKLQNKHMGSFPIKLGNQPYTFDSFLKCLSAPNIWFAKCYFNVHHLAFIQNAFKTFPNFKTKCMVSFYI